MHRNAVIRGKARTGPNLGFEALGQGDGEAGGHQGPFTGGQHLVGLDSGGDIQSGASRRGIAWQRQIAAMGEPLDMDLDRGAVRHRHDMLAK